MDDREQRRRAVLADLKRAAYRRAHKKTVAVQAVLSAALTAAVNRADRRTTST